MTDKPGHASIASAPTGLQLLRKPFGKHQISKLPKPTRAQTEEVKKDFRKGIRCQLCGAWHHPDVVHLDYVGHAALTDRLLDCDPEWNWQPMAREQDGSPRLDQHGGLWIELTVCGVTRAGYGHPDGKQGGDAIKETIGDALRNAAMRFGAALDLWHKGDLHADDVEAEPTPEPEKPKRQPRQAKTEQPTEPEQAPPSADDVEAAVDYLTSCETLPMLKQAWDTFGKSLRAVPTVIAAKDARKKQLEATPHPVPSAKPDGLEELLGDSLPY